jgi:hypothetical protein
MGSQCVLISLFIPLWLKKELKENYRYYDMSGRPLKQYSNLYRDVFIEIQDYAPILFANILILCPICQSELIGTFGTKQLKSGRIEMFQCKNPQCPHLKTHKYGNQFSLKKSFRFKQEIMASLSNLYEDLVLDGAKNKTIAKKYHLSQASISLLRKDLEDTIQNTRGLDQLVSIPQPDRTIALDETFLKIEGKSIYIIIATGYTTHKTLGLKVSETRNEEDIRQVFDEADRNTKEPIVAASIDAWGASQSMAKNLNREFTLFIHKHKSPYDRAVIRHFTYTSNERIITDVGVKVDVFKHRGTREYHYQEKREPISVPPPKPVGRPKGVKNGQKKSKSTAKKTRGKKGLFTVFTKGTRGYMKVDPFRKAIKFGKDCLGTVAAALNSAFNVYARMTIQNNIAENINSVLQSIIRLRGPKTIQSAEKRLRATLIVRNDPTILKELVVSRNMHGIIVTNNIRSENYARMIKNEWIIGSMIKKEVLRNC